MKHFLSIFKTGVLVLLFSALLFAACKKKEIQGPAGDPGTPGVGGNSNLVASSVFVIASSQWKPNLDSTVWQFKIDAPQISEDVATKGVVKVLIQDGTAWWELPYLAGEFFMQFGFATGSVTLSYLDPHGEKLAKPATANFRLVTLLEIGKPGQENPSHESQKEIDEIPFISHKL